MKARGLQWGGVGLVVTLAWACSDPSKVTAPRDGSDPSVMSTIEDPGIAAFGALDLGPAGGFPSSIAEGINVVGTTVGVSYAVDPQLNGVVTAWTPAGGAVAVGRPAGYFAAGATAINDGGLMVGFANRAGNRHSFMFTAGGGFVVLTGPPGTVDISAMDVNNAGTIVGEVSNGVDVHAYRFSVAGGYQDLHPAGYLSSHADGISNGGAITGWAVDPAGATHVALWSAAGGFADLGTLPGGTTARGYDINAGMGIVGRGDNAGGVDVAALWRPGFGMVGVPVPQTAGLAISDLGRMGGYVIVGGNRRAGTKKGSGPLGQLPILAGWMQSDVRAVNLCGTMVGSATFAGGITHAARWRNIPCD